MLNVNIYICNFNCQKLATIVSSEDDNVIIANIMNATEIILAATFYRSSSSTSTDVSTLTLTRTSTLSPSRCYQQSRTTCCIFF